MGIVGDPRREKKARGKIALQRLLWLPDHETFPDPVMPSVSRVGCRTHPERHRVVNGRAQARKQVGVLPVAETGEFVEADVLKLRGVVLINIVFSVEISERKGCARRKGKAFVGVVPYSVGVREP